MTNKFCVNCGTQLEADSIFCTMCGAQLLDNSVSDFREIIGNTQFADRQGGEMIFTQSLPSINGTEDILGPIKYLLNGIENIFKGFKSIFSDKKKLITAIALITIWIVLALFPMFGIGNRFLRFLSFLTFASGGMGRGIVNMIGGIVGKSIYAYFIVALILPIFSGNNPFKGIGGGFNILFKSFAVKDMNGISPLLIGSGVSLVIYNFLNAYGILLNSIIGIVGFLMALRALSSKTGFLRGFINSLINKFNKKQLMNTSFANSIIAGMTSGFAIAILLSFIPFPRISYIVGILFILVGVIIKLVGEKS